MKKVIGLLACVITAFILSCQSSNLEPNYSIIPYIELRDFEFIKGDISKLRPDTFKLNFYLRDGDFDLGQRSSDPFNGIFVYDKKLGEFIATNEIPHDHSNLIVYSDRKTIDTLPPLSCSKWQPYIDYTLIQPVVTDTVYVLRNRSAYNLNTDLYYLDANQAWVRFDFLNSHSFPGCSGYVLDGIFGPLGGYVKMPPFFYKPLSSKEGIMTYTSQSLLWFKLFKNKTIKLRFSIRDRALHQSNVVETNEILIQ